MTSVEFLKLLVRRWYLVALGLAISVGVRQKLGDWNTSVSLVKQYGYNEIAYFPINRNVALSATAHCQKRGGCGSGEPNRGGLGGP